MQFRFDFKHLEALDSIKDYAQKRFEKLDKFNLHKEMKIHFIFSVQRTDQICEVNVDVGTRHYTATAKDPTLYAAIDACVDKVERQLQKEKDRIQNHHSFENSREGYLRKELADQARTLRVRPEDHAAHGVAKAIKKSS